MFGEKSVTFRFTFQHKPPFPRSLGQHLPCRKRLLNFIDAGNDEWDGDELIRISERQKHGFPGTNVLWGWVGMFTASYFHPLNDHRTFSHSSFFILSYLLFPLLRGFGGCDTILSCQPSPVPMGSQWRSILHATDPNVEREEQPRSDAQLASFPSLSPLSSRQSSNVLNPWATVSFVSAEMKAPWLEDVHTDSRKHVAAMLYAPLSVLRFVNKDQGGILPGIMFPEEELTHVLIVPAPLSNPRHSDSQCTANFEPPSVSRTFPEILTWQHKVTIPATCIHDFCHLSYSFTSSVLQGDIHLYGP